MNGDAATPDEWVQRCAKRLRELVLDMEVTDENLLDLARDMVEQSYYSHQVPEEAAERWKRQEY